MNIGSELTNDGFLTCAMGSLFQYYFILRTCGRLWTSRRFDAWKNILHAKSSNWHFKFIL